MTPIAQAPARRDLIKATLPTAAAWVLVFGLFALPMLWVVLKTLQPQTELFSSSWAGFTLENYERAIRTGDLVRYTLNTCLISFWTCAIVLPLGFLGGYAFARFTFVGKNALLFMFIFSLTIPGLVNLLAIYQAFNFLRLLDTQFGLVIVYAASNLPLATWFMRAYVQAMPPEIEEAALVDGATRVSAIWHVTVPNALPGIAAVAVLVVVHVFHEFIMSQTLITTRGLGVVAQGLYAMQSEYDFDTTAIAAGSVLVSAVPVLLFLILQRQFISSMTSGALKS